MRVAFVGKGGSGKSTIAALFAHSRILRTESVLAFDADINMHLPALLGIPAPEPTMHLSHAATATAIRSALMATNPRIESLKHFVKSTPPTRTSPRITSTDPTLLLPYLTGTQYLKVGVVGSYEEESIGASCYHNNLAILENILSHIDDRDGWVIADMVAGVDAFSNTLHAQFDILALIVEPTQRSIGVWTQYYALAQSAGVAEYVCVLGNKVRSDEDVALLKQSISDANLLGYIREDPAVRASDRSGSPLQSSALLPENMRLLEDLATRARASRAHETRTERLHALHRTYVAQTYIAERLGDLTHQIEEG
ncbi:ATP-binding protein [Patescibacteria group bacterium]|nr:ATP-binding protein [Patescibacteria group bacterium]